MIAWLLATFVIVGRWSPLRLIEFPGLQPIFLEPRAWITLLFIIVLLLPIRRPRSELDLHHEYDNGPVTALISIFLLYMVTTAMWSLSVDLALVKAYELILILLAVWTLHKWLAGSDEVAIFVNFWMAIFVLAGLLVLVALAGLLFNMESQGLRVAVLAGGPNVFGRSMGLFGLAALFWGNRTGRWLVAIALIVLASILVIASGSRGALLGHMVGLAAFILIARIRVTRLMITGIVVAILGGGILLYTPFGSRVIDTFQFRVIDLTLADSYVSYRDIMYADAIDLGLEYPIAGSGLASYRALGLGIGNYQHNSFLEAFSEGGGIGLFLLVLLFWSFLGGAWKRRNRIEAATMGAFFLVLISSQVSGDLYDNRSVFLFMLLVYVNNPGKAPTILPRHSRYQISANRTHPRKMADNVDVN
jgi:O-antigen ligase